LTVFHKILSVEYYFGKFKIIHFLCSKTVHHACSKNYTVIRYSYRQTCGNPLTCFSSFWPSSGRYSTNKNTIMAINGTDLHYHCIFLSFTGVI